MNSKPQKNILWAFLLLLLVCMQANAQSWVGVSASPLICTLSGRDVSAEVRYRAAGEFNIYWEQTLGENTVLSTKMGYWLRGAQNEQRNRVSVHLCGLSSGINYLLAGNYSRFYLGAGLGAAVKIQAFSDKTNISYAYKRWDWSAHTSLGWRKTWVRGAIFNAELRYSRSLRTVSALLPSPPPLPNKAKPFLVYYTAIGFQVSVAWPLGGY